MKILVVGGTGLIGSQVVANLAELGHEAVSASPSSGVDTVTGEGVEQAVTGADVVVDVSNSPSFADDDVLRFFTTSTRNLLQAEQAAGVHNHVALSIVGTDRVPESGYLRAKAAQEKIIIESGAPYSIVRATQFFEFVTGIADSATEGGVVRLSHKAAIQPIAAADVATAVTRAALDEPLNAIINVAGPEKYSMDDFVRIGLAAHHDSREVVTDPAARYFGGLLDDHSIVPLEDEDVTIFPTSFGDWAADHLPNAT
ncbi:SDR family oxidoreductase [Mycobacterium kiyosense]|uniref:LysR family transcriptional regulator n=1 Tax=Mycobacterium kiyosense TaxID=2871094 RepID=A0A9P3QDX0_9MYCO|nr:SDR family oxidoreductase [Mycobacterium kiyosense]GLB86668.1 LysR family transcriptional regulator [Mycobacterium kiyosense]GLB99225.1 LysR family transcriptional regulator [Mycobacterium kiyosense]GLC09807.1 LysR family transcriptional regulator [Mycobacterium kiyosense]GLD33714.1 LysR family transcriptional regulator [Mycobacterium kiyosense]GLD39408.1 LysR family transcriptional regulator [Mycobacterium kiyosense]